MIECKCIYKIMNAHKKDCTTDLFDTKKSEPSHCLQPCTIFHIWKNNNKDRINKECCPETHESKKPVADDTYKNILFLIVTAFVIIYSCTIIYGRMTENNSYFTDNLQKNYINKLEISQMLFALKKWNIVLKCYRFSLLYKAQQNFPLFTFKGNMKHCFYYSGLF